MMKKISAATLLFRHFSMERVHEAVLFRQRLGSKLKSEKLSCRRLPAPEGVLRRREVQAAARPLATSWETCALT